MKWLVREKLAPWLRVTIPSKTPAPSVSTNVNNDAEDFQQDGQQLHGMTLGTTDTLLMEIRDLLQRKVGNKVQDPDNPNEDNENKNDWKLAAKVVDRIFLIIFTILFLGANIIFFVMFATHG